MMTNNDESDIINHKETPKVIGFVPALAIILTLRPAPTRKMVRINMDFAPKSMAFPKKFGIGRKVFTKIATTKSIINFGIFTLLSFPLNIHIDKNERGIIHKALDNLTVVATSNALAPYSMAAPTTELVS